MILKAEGISKQYLRKSQRTNIFSAVHELDFTLEEGKLTEITGRSGSGKSTLLNMLAGLLKPSTGKVYLEQGNSGISRAGEQLVKEESADKGKRTGKEEIPFGTDLYTLDDKLLSKIRNRCIGVIPQGHTPLYSLTVLENILLPASLYMKDGDVQASAAELMEQVGISNLKDAMPSELSGGELRRLSIARALIQSPSILLADEPTGDLDDENTEVVLKLLRETADRGTSVLLVTHEPEAAKYADHLYKMNAGNLEK